MKSYYITDTGKVRTHNEDSVMIVKNLTGEYLMVVADGMGGHKAGEVASSIVVNGLTDKFKAMESIGEKQEAVNWIRENASLLNDAIFKYTDEFEESKGMGTTLVLAVVTNDYILFGNVGDSSGYVMKKGVLYKVTKDHTLVNLLVETGELTPEEAVNHPRKNVLMRALGANNPIDVVYTLIWLEELIPNYSVNLECTKNLSSDDVLKIQTAIDKWNLMKSKRDKREISYKEYTNWKLTYNFGGDSND